MEKNKRSMKRAFLGLLAVSLLLPTMVQAGYYLPESSFWQGGNNYNKDGVQAFVEYAVYDTTASTYHGVLDGAKDGFVNPGTGQYIYAYQVLNLGQDLQPIMAFQLLGGNPALASGIGSARDGSGTDIVPTNNGTSFLWTFKNGVFVFNEHSAFMVFSTDKSPVEGTLKLSTLADYGNKPPTTDIPEPATLAMLAAGAIGLMRKRKTQKS